MKVEVNRVNSYQRKLDFVVPASSVTAELEIAFRELSKQVSLRGFRPGKAPRAVLEARFGPRVAADVTETLIQRSWKSAIAEHGIQPVSRPRVDLAEPAQRNDDLAFTITVDVRPELELQQYVGVEIVYPTFEVTDAEVDAAVAAKLEGEARMVEVTDRASRKGDMVLCELRASDGDDQVVFEQGTMIRTDGDQYYTGVEELVTGANIGDERSGRVAFAGTARTEEVAGRELDVTVKVLAIQAREIPELTDELAASLGYEGGIVGMREALRAQQGEPRRELARNQARANVLEKLIEVNPFEVPAGLIDQSLDMLLTELRNQEAYRTGRDPRTVGFSEAQIADLRTRATFAAKAGLILEHVCKTENLEVTEADIDARYQELADERGQTVEAVRGWFVKEDEVDSFKDQLLEIKAIDWLLERATIISPSVPAEAPAAEPSPEADASADGTPASEG